MCIRDRVIGGVSACGQKDDGKTSESRKTTESTAASASAENPGNAEDSGIPEELTLPLTEEKKELTVWMVYNGTEVSDLNEIKSVQKMEELTNVHINWIAVGQQELTEKFGLVLGSGDYPDIMAYYSYPGGRCV